MKKTNNKLITIILVIIIMTTIVLILIPKKEYKTKESAICETIIKDINSKKDVIVFALPEATSMDTKETIKKIKENYKEENIYHTIKINDIKKECIDKMLINETLYEELKGTNDSAAILYKNNENVGVIQGIDEYSSLENYFIEVKVIDKIEIKEEVTLETYNQNIKGEYLLLTITTEKHRKTISDNMKKVFPDINQDTINIKSDIGNEIMKDISKRANIDIFYPQVFYIKDGKVIKNTEVYEEETFIELKKEIEKLSN